MINSSHLCSFPTQMMKFNIPCISRAKPFGNWFRYWRHPNQHDFFEKTLISIAFRNVPLLFGICTIAQTHPSKRIHTQRERDQLFPFNFIISYDCFSFSFAHGATVTAFSFTIYCFILMNSIIFNFIHITIYHLSSWFVQPSRSIPFRGSCALRFVEEKKKVK